MKMVFFSSDRLEVERLKQQLAQEGIACERHDGLRCDEGFVPFREAELWVQNDVDAYRALMLCVERETGFSTRAPKPLTVEDLWDAMAAA